MIEEQPWWVAVDVCSTLDISNPSQAMTRLDDDEKQLFDLNTLCSNEGMQGNSLVNIINEPGLYSLVLSSRKPEAKKFKRWITHEVIPSIRKTGSYSVNQEVDELETLGNMILAISAERKRVRQLEAESKKLNERLNQIETSTDHFTIIGYMRYTKNKNIDLPTAAKLGSKMTRYCKEHEVSMGTVPDPRFGTVHTYPKWSLDKVISI